MIGNSKAWTEEEEEKLRKLWGTATSSDLAEEFGRTRNALCGKANRMGLSEHTKGFSVPRLKSLKAKKEPGLMLLKKKLHTRPLPPDIVVKEGGIGIMELNHYHCRAVITMHDPSDQLARYCGAASLEGQSFCADHAKVYFQSGGH